MTHLAVGRVDEAVATLRGLISDDVPVCKRSFLLTNLGWALLGSEAAGAPETGEILARAEEGYAACDATTPDMRANARLNRALWALRAGQPDLALSLVEVPLGEGVRPDVLAWTQYVRAALRPAEARGPALEAVARVAADAGLEDLRWRALVDAGRAYEVIDQGAAAVARFAEAEEVVAARAFDIPVDAGRAPSRPTGTRCGAAGGGAVAAGRRRAGL
ncbi:MAG: hypothetical protein H6706_14490 [Myxococcales bacterium]|nr:hypothetical protein [Myxococcales bacterium]